MADMVLEKFLAKAGVASRRKAVDLITAGRVQVNGTTVTELPVRIDPGVDKVTLDGKRLRIEEKRYVMLHKPRGYICTAQDVHADKLAIDLVADAAKERLFSIGRLDKDSEGLLLFTNDGELANRLTHPRYEVQKIYEVTVGGIVTSTKLTRFTDGIESDGDMLRALEATVLRAGRGEADSSVLQLVIAEGKNREIRRMCDAVGWHVRKLMRVQVGPIRLGGLENGECRDLTNGELTALRRLTDLAAARSAGEIADGDDATPDGRAAASGASGPLPPAGAVPPARRAPPKPLPPMPRRPTSFDRDRPGNRGPDRGRGNAGGPPRRPSGHR